MGTWTKAEIAEAFAHYQEVAAEAGRTGNWQPWADLFTEDALYIEHLYGTMHGRQEIAAWITTTMTTYPGSEMPSFPISWSVIDEERGWVVTQVMNRMRDLGDGQVFEEPNITILHYAGHGQWSYEEDVYNPMRFGPMLKAWEAARDAASA